MTGGPEVALVAVTHNSSVHLAAWLDHVEALRDEFALEVCVVDCGSSPAEREFLQRTVTPRVEHLVLERNVGYAAGCNTGAAYTSAPVLVFLNPDSYVVALPPELHDPAALQGRLLGHLVLRDGRFLPHGFRRPPTAGRQLASLLVGGWSGLFELAEGAPAWLSGSGIALTRDDFARLGGWATEFFLFYEDADLCARHRALGGRVEIADGFRLEHGRHRVPDLRREFVELRSGRLYVRRTQGRLAAAGLYAATLAFYLPRRVVLTLVRGPRETPVRRMIADALVPRRAVRRLQEGRSA